MAEDERNRPARPSVMLRCIGWVCVKECSVDTEVFVSDFIAMFAAETQLIESQSKNDLRQKCCEAAEPNKIQGTTGVVTGGSSGLITTVPPPRTMAPVL